MAPVYRPERFGATRTPVGANVDEGPRVSSAFTLFQDGLGGPIAPVSIHRVPDPSKELDVAGWTRRCFGRVYTKQLHGVLALACDIVYGRVEAWLLVMVLLSAGVCGAAADAAYGAGVCDVGAVLLVLLVGKAPKLV
ncbi:hypothetical protein QBC45DRAFT_432436 [Copromyces sp. CBS 386.78]|nr:hypothetical protein QBC45DRAFT_432436 [Copromyces sp. CBS 386.78]